MSVDPNDLLIFKVREQKKKPVIEEKKPEPKAAPAPKIEEKPKPVIEEAPKPAAQKPPAEAPKPERKLFTLFAKKEEKPAEQRIEPKREAPKPAPVPRPAPAEMPVYRPKPVIERPAEQPKRVQPESTTMRDIYASVQREAQQQLEAAVEAETGELTAKEILGKRQRETKSEAESIAAAKNQFCAWHPWRPAYAVCSYCHRPFCYEDTTEYNGALYCLEDIDKVSAGIVEKTGLEYNNISIVASTLMFVTFLAFMYFANAQLGYIVGFANSVGFIRFVSGLTLSYGLALLGAITTFFTIIAAILILAQSRKGYYIGLGAGFVNVALFSYQYLNTSTLYLLVISILAFASLVTLAYSRSAFEEKEIPYLETKQYGVEWPNAGRF
ncbi:MAG: hypothetical protein KGH60_04850 [Candidatus Micrarchaeota archaeon]|nr:hypothetical protein [Candidatus Micrarchaeota archaeon]